MRLVRRKIVRGAVPTIAVVFFLNVSLLSYSYGQSQSTTLQPNESNSSSPPADETKSSREVTVNGFITHGSSVGSIFDESGEYYYGDRTKHIARLYSACPTLDGEIGGCAVHFIANNNSIVDIVSASTITFPAEIFDADVCPVGFTSGYDVKRMCVHVTKMSGVLISADAEIAKMRIDDQVRFVTMQRVLVKCKNILVTWNSVTSNSLPPGIHKRDCENIITDVKQPSTSESPKITNGEFVTSDIPLQNNQGVFKVPVVINNSITLAFLIDSGASDVTIPADVFGTLIRAGTITQADFLGTQTYVLADGSKVSSQTFRIRTLKVGGYELHDVTASVADIRGELLLGQSFLSRFKRWSINNSRQTLVLEW